MALQTLIDQWDKERFNTFTDQILILVDHCGYFVVDGIVDDLIETSVTQDTTNVRVNSTKTNDTLEFVDLDRAKDEGHLVFELSLNREILQLEREWSSALVAHGQSEFLQQIDQGVRVEHMWACLQALEVEMEFDLLAKGVADL